MGKTLKQRLAKSWRGGEGKRKDVGAFSIQRTHLSRSLEQAIDHAERKRRRSDFSDSDSVALRTPLTAKLTTPTPTPTQTLSLVKTSSLNSISYPERKGQKKLVTLETRLFKKV